MLCTARWRWRPRHRSAARADRPKSVTRLLGVGCLLLAACGGQAHERASHAPPPGLEYDPPSPGTYELPPIQPAADGDVLDTDGAERRLFDYLGDRLALPSFVYAHCNDATGCPKATAVLSEIKL